MAKKILVIGGSAAGPKAAARVRRLDPHAEITLLQKSAYFSMASCGYPYYVGGFFDDRNQLLATPTGVVRDTNFFLNAKGINAISKTEAVEIDRKAKKVKAKNLSSGESQDYYYDKLILATGARPKLPPVPGADLEGVTTLQSMEDADFLRKVRDEKKIKEAVVIGGGLIGVETCEALHLAGIKITLVEMSPQILMFLDPEMAKLLENHIRSKAAMVITNNRLARFIGEAGKLKEIELHDGSRIPCQLAVVAIGVTPNAELAQKAGLKLGKSGAIQVNAYLETSDKDIYAVGDCIEIKNRLTKDAQYSPYGDLANLQGRVAAENAVRGRKAVFPGNINTGICKVFDFAAGATGLSESKARSRGLKVSTVINASQDKPGFMGGKLVISKIVVESKSRRLLGYQCLGPGDVSKQIAQAAMAIQGGLKLADLVNLDLPYAPPFSLAIDHFIASAHILENKLNGLFRAISAQELQDKLTRGEKPFLLDLRGPDEFEEMRLGMGEKLIPLGALRKKMGELPMDKNQEIVCYCKISLRGYEGARLLMGEGYTNVKVLEGGIVAWPYKREK